MKPEPISIVCANGIVLRPVRKRKGWHYQVFDPHRGLFPINDTARSDSDNRQEMWEVSRQMGGGQWV